jgi:hypothetical protein
MKLTRAQRRILGIMHEQSQSIQTVGDASTVWDRKRGPTRVNAVTLALLKRQKLIRKARTYSSGTAYVLTRAGEGALL